MIEICVDFFSLDVFDKLSFWLKCWYKLLVQIYHIFKILYFMIKCQNYYTAVSNVNKNILPLVDVSKGLSFLWTCLIFHIEYPGVLMVPIWTIPGCVLKLHEKISQGPLRNIVVTAIESVNRSSWKMHVGVVYSLMRLYSRIRSENVLKYLKQDTGGLPMLMQPSRKRSLQPSNLKGC